MAHIVLIGALPESLTNFRGDLIRALVSAGHRVTAMAAPASAEEVQAIHSLGAVFLPFPVLRNALSPWGDMQTLLALRKAFRELKPDTVLAYTVKPVVWGGIALFGRSEVKFFALITGLGFAFQGQGLLRMMLTRLVSWLYRIGLAKAAGVIFQNTEDREVFVSNRLVPASKCFVVASSGVDVSRFNVAQMPATAPAFLLIARLLGEKGLREYAHAARLVKRLYPDTVFRLLGPQDPSINRIPMQEILSWQAEGIVEYLGSTTDVRPYITNCHIFVLPSFYGEGVPRTIIEASAMGRPILTTDNVGCRDTVIPGENGFLVPIRDFEALADRMIWFIKHRDQWPRMGKASRRIAEERFNVQNVNNEMLRIMNLKVT